jgi:16S rRNA (adenine1518-N6/adenine1519-N6)-dimethyltransferase
MQEDLSIAKKILGQHWLRDPEALNKITDMADISSSDTVLEIGPGLGSLTEILIKHAKSVIAVELDRSLGGEINKRFGNEPKLRIVYQDIRKYDLGNLPLGYKVVANIPYYLTSYLIRLLSQAVNPPEVAVLLVQREVALRLSAPPGKLSLLGVTAQLYWDIELGSIIPAELFIPPPKVDSQIVKLTRKQNQLVNNDLKRTLFQILKISFNQKRKTLVNSLSSGLRLNKTEVGGFLNTSGLNESIRPQQLSIEQWLNLAAIVQKRHLK